MSDTKRPERGSLFDFDKDESLFNSGAPRTNSQPQSLFGSYTPPTPRQGQPAQPGTPANAGGQPAQAQPRQQHPVQQAPTAPQQRPAAQPQTMNTAQRPQAPQNMAPQRPAAPTGQPTPRPPAPGTPVQNVAPQQAMQQNNPAAAQQAPQQRAAQPAANAGHTQVVNTQPRQTAPQNTTAGTPSQSAAPANTPANGQVYRPADSGQRLSQFAPRPAAEQATGPILPGNGASRPAAAQDGAHTRIVGQAAGNAQPNRPAQAVQQARPFAGFDEGATRIGQPVQAPMAQQDPRQATTFVDNGYNTPPANGSGRGANGGGNGKGGNNGGNGNGGGKGGQKNGQPGGKPKKSTVVKYVFINIGKFALTCMCIGIMIAAILFVQVAGYVVESTANDDLTLDLNAIASSQTGYMWAKDANGEYTVEYMEIVGDSQFRWASLSEISPYVTDALISTEDKTFYEHGGVNWGRTAYAAVNEVLSLTDNQFGGSTITQQLVKNLTQDNVVTDSETGATAGYMRKMREIFRAIGITNSYSKEMVLEAYLNTMPLTGTIKGVGAGSYEYFGKSPAELELHEAAMIVGITNWPTKYSPYSNPENCLVRRNDVLTFMYQDELITKSQYEEACAKELGLVRTVASNQEQTITSWYADAAINQVINDLADELFEGDRTSASNYFYNAGLNIELNVNLDIQKALEDMYRNGYSEDSPWPDSVFKELEDGTIVRPQSAMTIMDYDGHVLASAGGIGEKTVSRALNRASSSPRQVGSTMKGIANYVLGIEYNLITYSTNLMDSQCWFSTGVEKYNADGTPAYDWPSNYGSITNSPMGVYRAFAESTNTVAVRVGLAVGQEEMFDFAYHTMGLTNLVYPYEDENGVWQSGDMGMSSLVLGGQSYGATTEQMAAAYASYGNGGQYKSARYYSRVLDSQGNVVLRPNEYTIQTVSAETAYIMNRLMYNVVNMSGGTANGMGAEGFETVGKTGTTNDDKDRWFVGLTPYYVGAIWWGYDTEHTLYGYSAAASTNGTTLPWKTIMDQIHEGLPEKDFPEQPEGVITAAFCRETGMRATDECGNRGTGYYKADNLPDYCVGHSDAPAE